MPGSVSGGKKTAQIILARDPDHFKRIGAIGGSAKNRFPKGFAANPDLARMAGRKAGTISRRNHTYLKTLNGYHYYIYKPTGKKVKYAVKELA